MLSLGHLIMTYVDNIDDYIPVKFLLFLVLLCGLCSRTTIRLCFILWALSWGAGGFNYVLCEYVAGLIQAGSFLPLVVVSYHSGCVSF